MNKQDNLLIEELMDKIDEAIANESTIVYLFHDNRVDSFGSFVPIQCKFDKKNENFYIESEDDSLTINIADFTIVFDEGEDSYVITAPDLKIMIEII